jgi:hypothetical protein
MKAVENASSQTSRRAWPRRVRVPALHLLASASVAAIAALLVFGVWYPRPFAALSGGLALFSLLVSVDVVMGPTLSAIVASPNKPASELRRDLLVIVALQLAAFGYGMVTIVNARPVYMSFEVDRFRVVSANDIDTETLREALPEFRSLPWTGPRLVAAVRPEDPAEQMQSIQLGIAGFDLSMIPKNWRPYAAHGAGAWRRARPLPQAVARYPETAGDASRIARESGQSLESLRFLPLVSRRNSWIAVLAERDAQIVGYLPVEGFF